MLIQIQLMLNFVRLLPVPVVPFYWFYNFFFLPTSWRIRAIIPNYKNYSNSGLSKRYATLFSCKAFVHIKILVKTTGSLHFHLIYFFQCFAAEFPDTIFVAVHPGWVQTDMGNSQAWHTSKLVFSMRMRRRDSVAHEQFVWAAASAAGTYGPLDSGGVRQWDC